MLVPSHRQPAKLNKKIIHEDLKPRLTSESPRRGVPGVELLAEPDQDPAELTRIRRPNLSNLGWEPGSADQFRRPAGGLWGWELLEGSEVTSLVLIIGMFA